VRGRACLIATESLRGASEGRGDAIGRAPSFWRCAIFSGCVGDGMGAVRNASAFGGITDMAGLAAGSTR